MNLLQEYVGIFVPGQMLVMMMMMMMMKLMIMMMMMLMIMIMIMMKAMMMVMMMMTAMNHVYASLPPTRGMQLGRAYTRRYADAGRSAGAV
jgi:hypothetical protein